jgi:cytochrome c oxidase assembly factor CtaG
MHVTEGLAVEPLSLAGALASTLAVAALVYIRGWLRLRHVLPHIASPWVPCAFLCGLLALWIAAGSPLARYDHALLSAHMVQHLLLSAVAAPLVLLGAPALPLLHGMPARLVSRAVAPLLRSLPATALARVLGDPAVCWSVAMMVFIGWHTPAMFALGLHSERWHAAEQASFFASGLMFWWPVIQPWPSRARWPRWSVPLYLFAATLPCDALSAFLAFSDRVVYPVYLAAPRHFGLSAQQDQECAGALMWLCVTIAYVVPAAVIITRMLSPQREQPARAWRNNADAIAAHSLDVDRVPVR